METLQLLVGQEVFIRQGDGGESSDWYSARIRKFDFDQKGKVRSVVLDSGKVIPYDERITTISVVTNAFPNRIV